MGSGLLAMVLELTGRMLSVALRLVGEENTTMPVDVRARLCVRVLIFAQLSQMAIFLST